MLVITLLATTSKLDSNVRKTVIQLGDSKLLAKLSEGDMIAIDARYHKQCLTSFLQ